MTPPKGRGGETPRKSSHQGILNNGRKKFPEQWHKDKQHFLNFCVCLLFQKHIDCLPTIVKSLLSSFSYSDIVKGILNGAFMKILLWILHRRYTMIKTCKAAMHYSVISQGFSGRSSCHGLWGKNLFGSDSIRPFSSNVFRNTSTWE